MDDAYLKVRGDCFAAIKIAHDWGAAVGHRWDNYALVHGYHPGFEDCGSLWKGFGGDLVRMATLSRGRVEDSSWIPVLRTRERQGHGVQGHVHAAQEAIATRGSGLDTNKLWAVETWREPAAEKYRATIPRQRAAIELTWRSTRTMADASKGLAEVGTQYLRDVTSAFKEVNRLLPSSFYDQIDYGPPKNGICSVYHAREMEYRRLGPPLYGWVTGALNEATTRMVQSAAQWLQQSGASDVVPLDVVPRTSVAGAVADPWPTM